MNTGGDVVTEFYAPYIEKDHDFYGEIERHFIKKENLLRRHNLNGKRFK